MIDDQIRWIVSTSPMDLIPGLLVLLEIEPQNFHQKWKKIDFEKNEEKSIEKSNKIEQKIKTWSLDYACRTCYTRWVDLTWSYDLNRFFQFWYDTKQLNNRPPDQPTDICIYKASI